MQAVCTNLLRPGSKAGNKAIMTGAHWSVGDEDRSAARDECHGRIAVKERFDDDYLCRYIGCQYSGLPLIWHIDSVLIRGVTSFSGVDFESGNLWH